MYRLVYRALNLSRRSWQEAVGPEFVDRYLTYAEMCRRRAELIRLGFSVITLPEEGR